MTFQHRSRYKTKVPSKVQADFYENSQEIMWFQSKTHVIPGGPKPLKIDKERWVSQIKNIAIVDFSKSPEC